MEHKPVRIAYMTADSWIAFASLPSKDMITVLNPHLSEKDYKILSAYDLERFDPDFLDALELNARKELAINLSKARILQKQRLRAQRQAILNKLDIAAMKALETGNQAEVARIAERKQQLRDITGLVDEANTLEAIKAITLRDYGGLLCTVEDAQGTGACLLGARGWFKAHDLDFERFISYGIESETIMPYAGEPLVKAILDHAFDRMRG